MQCNNDFAELYVCNSISKPIKILIIVYLTPFIVMSLLRLHHFILKRIIFWLGFSCIETSAFCRQSAEKQFVVSIFTVFSTDVNYYNFSIK